MIPGKHVSQSEDSRYTLESNKADFEGVSTQMFINLKRLHTARPPRSLPISEKILKVNISRKMNSIDPFNRFNAEQLRVAQQ